MNKFKFSSILFVLLAVFISGCSTQKVQPPTKKEPTLEQKARHLQNVLNQSMNPKSDKAVGLGVPIVKALKNPPRITITTPNDILFKFDKYSVNPSYKKVLATLSKELRTRFSDFRVDIEGYTDSTGKPAYNKKLSKKRANAIKFIFVKNKVSSSSITTKGYGESQKYAKFSNKTASGRKKNRRAVIKLYKKVQIVQSQKEQGSASIQSQITNTLQNTNEKTCSREEIKKYAFLSCSVKVGGCTAAKTLLTNDSKRLEYFSGKACEIAQEKLGFSSNHKIGEKEKIANFVSEATSFISAVFDKNEILSGVNTVVGAGSKIISYNNCVEHSLNQNKCF